MQRPWGWGLTVNQAPPGVHRAVELRLLLHWAAMLTRLRSRIRPFSCRGQPWASLRAWTLPCDCHPARPGPLRWALGRSHPRPIPLSLLVLQEEDIFVRCVSVLGNLADQLYYPCEHVAWAADAKILRVDSARWWTLSTAFWGLSLLLGIAR